MIFRSIVLTGFLVLAAVTAAPPPAAAQTIQGRGSAAEGDVVMLDGTEVKLSGIDAPDRGQTCVTGRGVEYDCFEMSRLALKRLLDIDTVTCTLLPGASFAQRRARCEVKGQDVAAYMVVTGWAMAYRRIAPEYIQHEVIAIARRRGLWDGRAEAPWLYRDRLLGENSR